MGFRVRAGQGVRHQRYLSPVSLMELRYLAYLPVEEVEEILLEEIEEE